MNRDLFFNNAGDERGTPQDLFDRLNGLYHFDIDVCASTLNHKVDLWFGEGGCALDALQEDWAPFVCWMNPPYSSIINFIHKAWLEAQKGAVVVGLVPVRSDTKWWHRYVWDKDTHQPREGVDVDLLEGRLEFELQTTPEQRALVMDLGGNMDMKDIIEQTGLPKMAIQGIWAGKPDEDLLAGAPFPSALITWRKP